MNAPMASTARVKVLWLKYATRSRAEDGTLPVRTKENMKAVKIASRVLIIVVFGGDAGFETSALALVTPYFLRCMSSPLLG